MFALLYRLSQYPCGAKSGQLGPSLLLVARVPAPARPHLLVSPHPCCCLCCSAAGWPLPHGKEIWHDMAWFCLRNSKKRVHMEVGIYLCHGSGFVIGGVKKIMHSWSCHLVLRPMGGSFPTEADFSKKCICCAGTCFCPPGCSFSHKVGW